MSTEATLSITVTHHDGLGPMMLCQEWVSGTFDGTEFDLVCGAGLGSPIASLRITLPDGRRITEEFNMGKILPDWIDAAIARAGEAPVLEREPVEFEPDEEWEG